MEKMHNIILLFHFQFLLAIPRMRTEFAIICDWVIILIFKIMHWVFIKHLSVPESLILGYICK